jgi:hypothetical protein
MASSFAGSLVPMPLTFRNTTSACTDSLQLAFRLDRLSLSTGAQSAFQFRRQGSLFLSRGDLLKGISLFLLLQPIDLMKLLCLFAIVCEMPLD